MRLASPIGPIRLDIGFNPYEPQASPLFEVRESPDEVLELVRLPDDFVPRRGFLGRFRFHFSVGQAF